MGKPFTLSQRQEIEGLATIAMQEIELVKDLFSAIVALDPSTHALLMGALAQHGLRLSEGIHNDVDVVRELAEKSD